MTTELHSAAHRNAMVEALGVLGSGPEERFDRITRMTQEAFGVPLSFLNLVHDGLVTTQSTFGWQQGTSVPASEQFCATTVLGAEPLVIPDTTLDPRFAHTAAVAEHGIRFYAGAPLTMVDGSRVGTLCVMDAQPREVSPDDLALLRDLARWAERELGHVVDRDRVRRVRRGLVPEPVQVPGWTLDTLVLPGESGGDVADWSVASDGRLHLTVGEVSAAGRADGLLASDVRGAVGARSDVPLDVAVAGLEAQLTPDMTVASAIASVFHARVDTASGAASWTDAGHGLALRVRPDGGWDLLRSRDLPLGLQPEGTARSVAAIELGHGDRLVLFTDGLYALDGFSDLDAVVAEVVDAPDGATLVGRVRATVPDGVPATDVTLAVLSRA